MTKGRASIKGTTIILSIVLVIMIFAYIIYVNINNTPQKTLGEFYNAVYVTADLEDMEQCLVEDYKYYFEQAMTMAGMQPKFYESYREEALKLLGDNIKISIKVLEVKPRGNISNVTYEINMSGVNNEKTYNNSLDMLKINGKWYMTTHIQLPIGRNVYAY